MSCSHFKWLIRDLRRLSLGISFMKVIATFIDLQNFPLGNVWVISTELGWLNRISKRTLDLLVQWGKKAPNNCYHNLWNDVSGTGISLTTDCFVLNGSISPPLMRKTVQTNTSGCVIVKQLFSPRLGYKVHLYLIKWRRQTSSEARKLSFSQIEVWLNFWTLNLICALCAFVIILWS